MSRLVTLIAGVLALATTAHAQSIVTFSDGEFVTGLADWFSADTIPCGLASGDLTGGIQLTLGGNPGNFLRAENTYTNNGPFSLTGLFLHAPSVYDPAVTGEPIDSIDFSIDAKCFSETPPQADCTFVRLALRQGADVYPTVPAAMIQNPGGWQT